MRFEDSFRGTRVLNTGYNSFATMSDQVPKLISSSYCIIGLADSTRPKKNLKDPNDILA